MERWAFTGQRKSLVDSKQTWRQPRASQNGFFQCLTMQPTLTSIHDHRKNHSLD